MAGGETACRLADFDRAQGSAVIAGVDEAGRGPLAGPVVAAAVIMPCDRPIAGVDDSKRLTPRKREKLLVEILSRARAVGLGVVDAELIDRLHILRATEKAWYFALCGLRLRPDLILIDGPQPLRDLPPSCRGATVRSVVDGDARSYAVAAASIVAKCLRDALMQGYDRQHPGYGFARHKGYGTREHLVNLRRLGPCPIHRQSFAPVAEARAIARPTP